MKFFNTLLAISSIAFLTACATVNNPEGGAKDTKSPNLTSSSPKAKDLNVSTRSVVLEFDEEVQPNNLTKELLITPNTGNKYKVTTKRNRMELVFEKPLEDSTTYTFNFRNGIQDITEKNTAKGLMLTFSTGAYLDSSRISGKVVDLLSQTPEKETLVALYPLADTMNIKKGSPYYQALTNEAGEFSFENIKEGDYKIYALSDKNNNSIYDNENERVAYKSEAIKVTPKQQQIELQTIRIDTKKPILQRRENFIDRFTANYNEGIKSFIGRSVQSKKDTLLYKIAPDGKAIDIFGGNGFTGGKAIITATDSAGNATTDTLQIAFQGKRPQRFQGAQIKNNGVKNGAGYYSGQPITLEFETPVKINSKEPVLIYADSIVTSKINYPQESKLDPTATELTFKVPTIKTRNKQISIGLDSMGVVAVQGGKLKFNQLPITIAEAKGTGSLKGTITTKYTSYTLQLLDKDGKIKHQSRNQKSFDFRNLEPGAYNLRVLIDENKDGRWAAGDPELKREPEKVYIYNKPLEVRANWEVEAIKLEF
ncbi:Ig-like domain-containing protein [Pontibacter vulgaris]|uniref:Ig-like domain-containing protein n=1 Tax=Pontibacter vulgaris TaxID=2905679 RepID=UPI001FA7598C|nr:Ig-like domain-containing domain [Pontibacter vulgaris]